MLINAPRPIDVLVLLAKAPFEFHLTGSRFFGYDKPESDWDFFVDSEALYGASGLINWLEHNGFYKESSRDYNGETSGITQIWKHGIAPVHVQIVEDANLKASVQDILNSNYKVRSQLGRLSKEGRKALWNAVYAGFIAGEEKAARSVVDFQRRA
jgi:hypothetical protein